jgi:hypothetical protein
LVEVGCEAVSVFALCGRGYRYYRKGDQGVIHPHLPEGVDMVEDVVRECHKRDIKVLGYVSNGMSNSFLMKHPEYIQCKAPGEYDTKNFSGLMACMIGYGNRYLLKQYEELCGNYELDYFFLDGSYNKKQCFCTYCLETFKNETGLDMPLNQDSPDWNIYLNWYQKEMERFRAQVRETVHQARPGIETIINWSYSYRSPDPIPDDIDILFSDVPFRNEMEGIDICTRSFALTGRKFEIHNTAFLKHWGEWGLKHPTVLKRSAALLLANGTNVHMGYQFYPRFHVDNGVWNAFKEVFDWVKPREPYLQNNEIQPYIGAYFSNMQHGLTHTGEIWSEPQWLYGFNKLMIDCGLHYNLLGSEFMKRTIHGFSTVFLPDMRYISDEEVEIIENYVKNGGSIIVSGLPGTADQLGKYTGNSKLNEILGVEWLGVFNEPYSYLKITDSKLAKNTSDMPLTMEAITGLVNVTTANKLAAIYDLYKATNEKYAHRYSPAENDTGYAGVTINRYGKGYAVYFANEISEAYYRTFQWNLVEMIHNILFDILNIEKRVFATGDGSCEVTLAKRGEATQVHIVNMVGTMPNTMHTIGNCMPREVVRMSNIEVVVIHDKLPSKVILRPQNIELPFIADGCIVTFTIPTVDLYEIVEIY